MGWTAANSVSIGDPTKKAHYDNVFDNADYLADMIIGDGAEGSGASGHTHDGVDSLVIEKWNKNILINGDMEYGQEGLTFVAGANDDDSYTLDGWILLSDGDDIIDVSQDEDAPISRYSMKSDVETINKKFGHLQIVERLNAQRVIGGTASLSFQAKVSDITKLDNIKAVVLAWDGAIDVVISDVVGAYNAEDATPTWAANWTAENAPSNLGVTAAWAKYKIEGISIDTANTRNLAVFIWSDGFSDTLGKFLHITDVQLEPGDVATPFEYVSTKEALALCERYVFKSYNQGTAPGTATGVGAEWFYADLLANANHTVTLGVRWATMRTNPAVTVYDVAGTINQVTMAAGHVAGTINNIGTRGCRVSGVTGAANTALKIEFQYIARAQL